MSLAQYGGSNVGNSETVWYAGTNLLKTGQIVAVDLTANATLSSGVTSNPITDYSFPRNLLGSQAQDPLSAQTGGALGSNTASNLNSILGIVVPGQNNLQGPCWVDVQKPVRGDQVSVLNAVTATAGVTVLGASNGTNNAIAVGNVTTPTLAGFAICLQTLDNSGGAALTICQFI
jgi:hypothetical protein